MSDKIAPIGHKTRIYVTSPSEFLTFVEYRDLKAKEHKLDPVDVARIAAAAKAGLEYDTSEIEDKTQKKRMEAYKIEAESDFSAHEKHKAIADKNAAAEIQRKKDEREAAEKAKEEDKKESLALMTEAEGSKKLITLQNTLTTGADKGISQVLGKAFKLTEDGLLEIVGDPQKSDFASAFSGINGLQKTSDIIKDRSAKTEAQVAFAARNTLGESWVNLFSHVPKDLARVKSGLKIYGICSSTKAGLYCFAKLPISTTKALTEMKITTAEEEGGDINKANEKNLEAKLAVLKRAALLLRDRADAGGTITQTEAKNLVTEYKNENNVVGKIRYKYCYGHVIDGKMQFSGSVKISAGLLGTAAFCFDYNMNQFIYKEDGNVDQQPVSAPSKAVAKLAADFEEDLAAQAKKDEEEKAAKKNKKNKGKTPTKDELDEEDEDLPAPVGKPKAKVEFSDEDEDDAANRDDDAVEGVEEDETEQELKSSKAPDLNLDEEEDDEPVRPAKKTVSLADLDDE